MKIKWNQIALALTVVFGMIAGAAAILELLHWDGVIAVALWLAVFSYFFWTSNVRR